MHINPLTRNIELGEVILTIYLFNFLCNIVALRIDRKKKKKKNVITCITTLLQCPGGETPEWKDARRLAWKCKSRILVPVRVFRTESHYFQLSRYLFRIALEEITIIKILLVSLKKKCFLEVKWSGSYAQIISHKEFNLKFPTSIPDFFT